MELRTAGYKASGLHIHYNRATVYVYLYLHVHLIVEYRLSPLTSDPINNPKTVEDLYFYYLKINLPCKFMLNFY